MIYPANQMTSFKPTYQFLSVIAYSKISSYMSLNFTISTQKQFFKSVLKIRSIFTALFGFNKVPFQLY